MTGKKKDDYVDIIGHPHHVSRTHPQMPVSDRAAQFSSFAALTGFGEAVEDTARYVEERQTPDTGDHTAAFEDHYDLEIE